MYRTGAIAMALENLTYARYYANKESLPATVEMTKRRMSERASNTFYCTILLLLCIGVDLLFLPDRAILTDDKGAIPFTAQHSPPLLLQQRTLPNFYL